MDIVICRIKYPNDPSGNIAAHQHFIGYIDEYTLELYSISSIRGKEYKVYTPDGTPNPDYYLIIGDEYKQCHLRVPSFIDCAKSYKLDLNGYIDITKLGNRDIPKEISDKIKDKINIMKKQGHFVQYYIKFEEFLKHNEKCCTI